MSRPPGVLDQSVGVGGSCNPSDTLDISQEPLGLGKAIAGQVGASASVSAVVSSIVTMTGLTGLTGDSVGRCITVSGSAVSGNNGTFNISAVFGSTTANYENALAIAPDGNNGSISWVEREPYSLEDDINYSRTDRRLVKGTANWHDDIPTYVRPTDTLTDVDANLTNIAEKTLDAHAWVFPKFEESVPVAFGDSFVTITDIGNLKHATSTDITGVPVFDGYDAGNDEALFVKIVDVDIDGYTDGAELKVLSGPNKGEVIFGQTRAGAATSPDSVEIVFYSKPIGDLSFSFVTPYTWEIDQTTALINILYGYRERLDRVDPNALRSTLIQAAGSASSSSGSGDLPTPDEECQVLYALTPGAFTSETPLTSPNGWLVNDLGCLLVIG